MISKKVFIEYDALNNRNTFTNGDTVHGRITVKTSKRAKMKSLLFEASGSAIKSYTSGDRHVTHSIRIFNIKKDVYRSQTDNTRIEKGTHIFPFDFKIPNSVLSSYGRGSMKIKYHLMAELKLKKVKKKRTAMTEFIVMEKPDMTIPGLLSPQTAQINRTIHYLGTGKIQLGAMINKMGYKQGETLQINIAIKNESKSSVRAIFLLEERIMVSSRTCVKKKVAKDKSQLVKSNSGTTNFTWDIRIPEDLGPSILRCSLFTVEHRLKITFKVRGGSDPKMEMPIIVLPLI